MAAAATALHKTNNRDLTKVVRKLSFLQTNHYEYDNSLDHAVFTENYKKYKDIIKSNLDNPNSDFYENFDFCYNNEIISGKLKKVFNLNFAFDKTDKYLTFF
jgi:hypothetical protein